MMLSDGLIPLFCWKPMKETSSDVIRTVAADACCEMNPSVGIFSFRGYQKVMSSVNGVGKL